MPPKIKVYRYRRGSTDGELIESRDIASSENSGRSSSHSHSHSRYSSVGSVTSDSVSAYSGYSRSRRDPRYHGSEPGHVRYAEDMPLPGFFSSGRSRDRAYRNPDIAHGYSGPVAQASYAASKVSSHLASEAQYARSYSDSRSYWDDDLESLRPDDSISQAGEVCGKQANHKRSPGRIIHPRSEMHSSRPKTTFRGKPKHLDPLPENDLRAFRAETGFGENDNPYYDAANDYGCGNYVLDIQPEAVLEGRYERGRHLHRVGCEA